MLVRDPGFYEPTGEDGCERFWSFCRAHDQTYGHESCGEGPHLLALHCAESDAG